MLIGSNRTNKKAWTTEIAKKQKQEYICVGKHEKWNKVKSSKINGHVL